MQNPQQPKDRIKRPEVFPQPEPEPIDNSTEELSQDELNEWMVQKIIRMELKQFRGEAIPAKSKPTEKPKHIQPYERQYGPTQEEFEKTNPQPKKKGGMNSKRLVMLVIILAAAGYIGYLAYQYLVLGYTFGG